MGSKSPGKKKAVAPKPEKKQPKKLTDKDVVSFLKENMDERIYTLNRDAGHTGFGADFYKIKLDSYHTSLSELQELARRRKASISANLDVVELEDVGKIGKIDRITIFFDQSLSGEPDMYVSIGRQYVLSGWRA